MSNIDFTATHTTPAVRYEENGRLVIRGRSISDNEVSFYQPLIDWACMLQADSLFVDIDLEYINSGSSKKLFYLLKVLDANVNIRKLIINWYYEEGDDEALIKGQVFNESLPKAEFRFHLQKDAV
jgi:hypothetical protein